MMSNIEHLKEIVANAPDGATNYADDGNFRYRMIGEEHDFFWEDKNKRWFACQNHFYMTRSLQDIKTIIAQDERIKELEAQIEASLYQMYSGMQKIQK